MLYRCLDCLYSKETGHERHATNPSAQSFHARRGDASAGTRRKREKDLETMDRMVARTKLHMLDRGIIFSGLRGVGKTVLLIALQELASSKDMATARIEAEGNTETDYDALFHEITLAATRLPSSWLRENLAKAIANVNSISLDFFRSRRDRKHRQTGTGADEFVQTRASHRIRHERTAEKQLGPLPVHRRIAGNVGRTTGNAHIHPAQDGTRGAAFLHHRGRSSESPRDTQQIKIICGTTVRIPPHRAIGRCRHRRRIPKSPPKATAGRSQTTR